MKQVVAFASAFAVLAAAGGASAAPCTSSTSGTCFVVDGGLSASNPVAIQDQNVPVGPYEAEGSFAVEAGVGSMHGFADIAFDEILPGMSSVPAGISNLTISFMQDATTLGTFLLTNPDGTTEGGSAVRTFFVTLVSASDVFFKISGDAFLNAGASLPDFNINLTAVAGEIPIPASLPLLISGVAGLSFAARKKRNAA